MSRLIIDVRNPEEYAQSHVEGAVNIPLTNLLGNPAELKEIPKDTELVLYCRSGNRSDTAIRILQTKGFTHLVNGINQELVQTKYTD